MTKLKRLDSGISTARKVDRLFWSLVDIQEVLDLIYDKNMNDTLKYLAIIAALCSAYHWYTENMIFLKRIQFLENVDTNAIGLSGAKADLIGTIIGLGLLYLIITEENDDKKAHIKKVKFFGMCCDLMHALDDSGAMEKIIGRSLNTGEYGIAGLLSALATLYRGWNS